MKIEYYSVNNSMVSFGDCKLSSGNIRVEFTVPERGGFLAEMFRSDKIEYRSYTKNLFDVVENINSYIKDRLNDAANFRSENNRRSIGTVKTIPIDTRSSAGTANNNNANIKQESLGIAQKKDVIDWGKNQQREKYNGDQSGV